ncbi:MAG: Rieske 2Fe-2S domain-containing protein [Gammaproteobacteria bacterium]|nr:Rieske 2Fe-2S domain-containing protein [Gammaproteobacteria bacterium]
MNATQGWLAVAAVEEVNGKTPRAVSAGGFDFALFRDRDGVARALQNRCPHRRVPLTLGKIIDGAIRCAYHGWTFDGGSGACIDVPNLSEAERVPPSFCVPAYPVAEHQGFVFVWAGEGEPGLLPPLAAQVDARLELETYGSGVAALGVDHYRDLLFDGPEVVFDIPGVRFTDFYLGDVRVIGDRLVIDREAEWGLASKPADIKLVDRPLVLRTEQIIGSGNVLFTLLDANEDVLASLTLAFAAGRRGTTSYCWRYRRYTGFNRQQPGKYRLLARGRAPVEVFEKLDGSAVAATLVGPSADLSHQPEWKIPLREEEMA